jgi:hypothetical protein
MLEVLEELRDCQLLKKDAFIHAVKNAKIFLDQEHVNKYSSCYLKRVWLVCSRVTFPNCFPPGKESPVPLG